MKAPRYLARFHTLPRPSHNSLTAKNPSVLLRRVLAARSQKPPDASRLPIVLNLTSIHISAIVSLLLPAAAESQAWSG
ncbi:hypothetical protein LY78DRAFT_650186 [Colletotrichum sublineola]|nr:hypothetical protein LY78DRAFT_650186 [Colletotrichum sublineola]